VESHPNTRAKALPKVFLSLAVAYFCASLGHFAHNAEFICEYPNLPVWLTRAQVYAVWAAITSVGLLGFVLARKGFNAAGLVLVAGYAALGFDSLGHYVVAPMAWHSLTANITILSEVATAVVLLAATLHLLALRVFSGPRLPG